MLFYLILKFDKCDPYLFLGKYLAFSIHASVLTFSVWDNSFHYSDTNGFVADLSRAFSNHLDMSRWFGSPKLPRDIPAGKFRGSRRNAIWPLSHTALAHDSVACNGGLIQGVLTIKAFQLFVTCRMTARIVQHSSSSDRFSNTVKSRVFDW